MAVLVRAPSFKHAQHVLSWQKWSPGPCLMGSTGWTACSWMAGFLLMVTSWKLTKEWEWKAPFGIEPPLNHGFWGFSISTGDNGGIGHQDEGIVKAARLHTVRKLLPFDFLFHNARALDANETLHASVNGFVKDIHLGSNTTVDLKRTWQSLTIYTKENRHQGKPIERCLERTSNIFATYNLWNQKWKIRIRIGHNGIEAHVVSDDLSQWGDDATGLGGHASFVVREAHAEGARGSIASAFNFGDWSLVIRTPEDHWNSLLWSSSWRLSQTSRLSRVQFGEKSDPCLRFNGLDVNKFGKKPGKLWTKQVSENDVGSQRVAMFQALAVWLWNVLAWLESSGIKPGNQPQAAQPPSCSGANTPGFWHWTHPLLWRTRSKVPRDALEELLHPGQQWKSACPGATALLHSTALPDAWRAWSPLPHPKCCASCERQWAPCRGMITTRNEIQTGSQQNIKFTELATWSKNITWHPGSLCCLHCTYFWWSIATYFCSNQVKSLTTKTMRWEILDGVCPMDPVAWMRLMWQNFREYAKDNHERAHYPCLATANSMTWTDQRSTKTSKSLSKPASLKPSRTSRIRWSEHHGWRPQLVLDTRQWIARQQSQAPTSAALWSKGNSSLLWCKVSQQAGSPQTACSRAMSCLQGFHSLASKQTHRKKCFDIIFLAQLMILIALTHLCQRAQQLQRCDSDSPLRFQKGTLPFGGSRSCLPWETLPKNQKPHLVCQEFSGKQLKNCRFNPKTPKHSKGSKRYWCEQSHAGQNCIVWSLCVEATILCT